MAKKDRSGSKADKTKAAGKGKASSSKPKAASGKAKAGKAANAEQQRVEAIEKTEATEPEPFSRGIDEADRRAGKQARAVRPRTSFAGWEPAADRPDPVEILEAQAATRVPELVPIRRGRMASSAFAFYRGAAAVMAWDLGQADNTGLDVQLCGDAHLANFGGFAAPDRTLVFDLNDFDETLPGPFEWDVQRLVASFEIAGRSRGFADSTRTKIVKRASASYRKAMTTFAGMTELDLWTLRLDAGSLTQWVGQEAKAKTLANLQRNLAKAQRKDRFKALARLTETVDGDLRFVSDPPLLVPAHEVVGDLRGDELDQVVQYLLGEYVQTLPYQNQRLLERYTYRHTARKVVGVGSVGTRCWVILFTGRDDADPLFLQVKQAEASVLEPFANPSTFSQHGHRVVAGQSLVQAATDPFLGWVRYEAPEGPRDFYIRQLWDWKASADLTTMPAESMSIYAEICGWTLARAHARSGDRGAIAAYLGGNDTFDRAMASFAVAYADQNDRDHAALVEAIRTGRLVAETGI